MVDPERTRRRLKAQTAAARVLLSSDTVSGGVNGLLRVVCESHGWPVGEYWSPTAEGDLLHLSAQWTQEGADLGPFLEATESLEVGAGSGLAGRVWDRDEAIRVSDVAADPEFIRAGPAGQVGLRGAFAVPVPLAGPDAVLLFLSRSSAEGDQELLDGLEAVGAQLGQFIRRRDAEGRLRESEERFRTFARTVPDPAFLLDRDGRILYANDAVQTVFGYEPMEIEGDAFTRLLPERHHAQHREGLSRGGGRSAGVAWSSFELEGVRRDGVEVPVEVMYGSFEQDRERYFTAVARDVTERRLTEDRLRFQARLLDAVGDAVIATQLDGTVLYWNEGAERVYGWSASEVLGRTVDEITPSDVSRDEALAIMERLRKGESWSGEFMVQDRDGRTFPVMVTDSPFLDERGDIVGIIGISTDITKRKRDESAQRFLAEAGRVLASSLDYGTTVQTVARLAVPTLSELCVVQAADDDEVRVVASAAEGRDERIHALEDWLEGPGRDVIDDVLLRCTTVAAPATDGPVVHDPDLEAHGITTVLTVPLRARGHALGVMTLAGTREYDDRDIRLAGEVGRRAALAMDNARLYRDAQEANRAKADFLAVVSHELRTPLNAIGGYADLLESGATGDLTEDQARYVVRVKVGANHLGQLIDEILSYARVEAKREQILYRKTDLGRLAREAAASVEPQAMDRNLDLVIDAAESGPVLLTDGDKVRQVLVNLLANAVKYTDEGSVTLQVAATPDGGAEMAVTDTGPGIEAEHLERIFEPFWQAESPNTRKVGGTGLGLAVSRRLATLIGGSIAVDSQVGEGSRFTVRLPATPPPAPGNGASEGDGD